MTQKIGNLKRDKLLTQCENLLLRGVESPTDISESLNISYNTAKTYISLIKSRWSNTSTIDQLQTRRQELIRKTEAVISEAWKLKDNAKNTLEAVGALRTALMGIERLGKLQGIDELPLPTEKPRETQIFEFAQEINLFPQEKKQIILSRVREEIAKRHTTT